MNNYKYNICFIRRGTKILLLNRNKAPIMGLWNGVGGKIEFGEVVLQSVIREVLEETGILLSPDQVMDKGVVSWAIDSDRIGGMHVFLAELDGNVHFSTPINTEEGILDWKDINWVQSPQNQGVAAHVPYFLPFVLEDMKRYEHHCIFKDGKLVDYKAKQLQSSC